MQEKMTKSPEFYAIFTIKGLGIKIFYYICARIPHGHKKIRKDVFRTICYRYRTKSRTARSRSGGR